MVDQSPNQFNMTEIQGQLDFLKNNNVIAGQVGVNVVTPLVAGQAVKIINSATKLPSFAPLAADTDVTFGFVVRNLKDQSFPALKPFELAINDSVMYMTSGAAIARGAQVEVVSATSKVITSAGINPVVGYALDQATATDQLIRVYINTLGQSQPVAAANTVQTVKVTATLAEINAGKTLIAGVASKSITVLNYTARVNGNFATGTAVILQSSNGTPVLVTTIAEAGLTTGAVLTPASANTTLGAGFAAPLGVGDGLRVVNSGSAQTGGTSIEFTLTYSQF